VLFRLAIVKCWLDTGRMNQVGYVAAGHNKTQSTVLKFI